MRFSNSEVKVGVVVGSSTVIRDFWRGQMRTLAQGLRHLLVKPGAPREGVQRFACTCTSLDKDRCWLSNGLCYSYQKKYRKYNYRTDKNSFQCGKSYKFEQFYGCQKLLISQGQYHDLGIPSKSLPASHWHPPVAWISMLPRVVREECGNCWRSTVVLEEHQPDKGRSGSRCYKYTLDSPERGLLTAAHHHLAFLCN